MHQGETIDCGAKTMRRSRRGLLAALALTLALLALAVAESRPAAAAAAGKAGGPTCFGKPATLVASPGQRLLEGTTGADVIVGSRRAEQIRGRGGNDLVCAGGGSDLLAGGPGRDSLAGGAGNDLVLGGAGPDRLGGGAGDDHLDGGAERDDCSGDGGADTYVSCEVKPNNPPSAGSPSATTDEDSMVLIDVLAQASDPDADPLRLTLLDPARGGEARVVERQLVRFDPGRRFEYLGPGGTATVALAFRVEDGRGASAEGTVTVTIEGRDDSPTAAADTAGLTQGAAATFIDVLANDADVDGGPKAVTSVTDPAHGTVAIAAAGAGLSYRPAAGYCNDGEEPDTFAYTLNGGSVATVSVRVACVTAVQADPPLTPAFDPEVSDYTVRCADDPVAVSGRAPAGTTVSVDGGPASSGSFAATVPLEQNQAFGFTTDAGSGPRSYTVRCLPDDFPAWDYERLRAPSHELYVVTPNLDEPLPAQFVVIFDRNGVPVWWDTEAGGTLQDAKVLSDGNIAWWNAASGYVIREPDGTLVREVKAVGFTDGHELQEVGNGNYLLISNDVRKGVDLTEFGGGANEDVEDMLVQEIAPNGNLVWSWSTKGHIGLAETGRWWPTALAGPTARDIIHMNAIEPVGEDAVLISNRHNDAIYKIDKASGEIVWKLGGTWTPKSLQVLGDPEGAYPFGGQHDIRLLADGTITVADNNTKLGAAPRAVRYSIDEAGRTATMIEQVKDPQAPSSFCCGSARRSDDGSWLMSWGGNSLVGEYDGAGQPNFRLRFGGTIFSYRAVAVEDGAVDTASLRAGMSAMHPR